MAELEEKPEATTEAVEETESKSEGIEYTDDDTLWLAWESNPELYNEFAKEIGVDLDKVAFREMWSLDAEVWPALLEDFDPAKVRAVILLFPSTDAVKAEKAKDSVDSSKYVRYAAESDSALRYFYQLDLFGNACGPIAVMHALMNAQDVPISGESLIGKLSTKLDAIDDSELALSDGLTLEKGKVRHPDDCEWTEDEQASRALWQARGLTVLTDKDIHAASDKIAGGGADAITQTATPDKEDDTDAHFIAFVLRETVSMTFEGDDISEEKKHVIVELDGRKEYPITHKSADGEDFTTPETFATDVIDVIKKKWIAGSEDPRFNVAVLELK
jgi:ubiquitin carboxyl-terminal hydrolase L3